MKLHPYGRNDLIGLFIAALSIQDVSAISKKDRIALRDQTKSLWNHGFLNYMAFAYPEDELKPISCRGQGRDHADPGNYGRNDVDGDYSLTYLDVLSTLPLIRGEREFLKAIDRVIREVADFDRDAKVQVFEVTIRILGSLLSSYQQLLEIEERGFLVKNVPFLSDSTSGSQMPITSWPGTILKSFRSGLFGKKETVIDAEDTACSNPRLSRKQRRRAIKSSRSHFEPSDRARALLALAVDLADRLVPAFDTPTSMPYARINLKKGIDNLETEETCAAATTSLTLEFTLLSQLTGNPIYEQVARRSFMNTWDRRIPATGLVGNQIGVRHGLWMAPFASGIGAGIDSFYEYALKGAVLFDDDEYMGVWEDSYRSVMQHVRAPDGHVFRNVNIKNARPNGIMLDSLSAFWPGLQVVAGNVEDAIESHLVYWHLWQKHSAMPEGFNYATKKVEWAGYPLRPEFVESTYWLYRATRDDFYLHVGKRILKDLAKRTKVKCGFAVLHNIHTGAKEDRMESFMLSETLKYLYLLFDDANPVNHAMKGNIFTTEGHILKVSPSLLPTRQKSRRAEFENSQSVCLAYRPGTLGGLMVGIRSRKDYDYTRTLVDMPLLAKDYYSSWATCEVTPTTSHHFEIAFANASSTPTNIPQNMAERRALFEQWDEHVTRIGGDLVVKDVSSIRALVTRSADNAAYEITSIGNHRVRPGQAVFLTDPAIASSMAFSVPPGPSNPDESRPAEIWVQLTSPASDAEGYEESGVIWEGLAGTAVFGRPMTNSLAQGGKGEWMGVNRPALPVLLPPNDPLGCSPDSYAPPADGREGFVALPQRGECTFHQKLAVAQKSGAVGVVVWGDDDDPGLIRPSQDPVIAREESGGRREEEIGMVYVPREAGWAVSEIISDGKAVSVSLFPLDPYTDETEPVGSTFMEEDELRELFGMEDLGKLLGDGLNALVDKLTGILGESKKNLGTSEARIVRSIEPGHGRAADQSGLLVKRTGDPVVGKRLDRLGPPPLAIGGLPLRNVWIRPRPVDL